MMSQGHVFSHQHQYASPDWQQNHQHSHHAAQQHAQAQAAAAAAAAAQQQHYNRIAATNTGSGPGVHSGMSMGEHSQGMAAPDQGVTDDNRRVLEWIAQLLRPETRETALLELSKKREQVPELALILWHSFGMASTVLGSRAEHLR